MLRDFRRWLKERKEPVPTAPELPLVTRDEVLACTYSGVKVPHVCWESTSELVASRPGVAPELMRRAIMAACLDAIIDAVPTAHARWRTANVEGLAPADGNFLELIAATAERSYVVLTRDLSQLRGDVPIPPVAIACIEPRTSYFEFTDSDGPSEPARVATSGGMYLNDGPESFPIVVVNSTTRHGARATVAHELTHHALHGLRVPPLIEEGFTQMMEERVTGECHFRMDREMVEKHREHWSSVGIDGLIDGTATIDPDGEGQTLAYHVSEWLVRAELQRRPKEFFAFVRQCRVRDVDDACRTTLGTDLRGLVRETLGLNGS